MFGGFTWRLAAGAALASSGCHLIFSYEPFEEGAAGGPDVCALHRDEPGDCAATLRDCNADAGDACETSIESDPLHCGYCGHACPESGCEASLCAPQVMNTQLFESDIAALGAYQGYLYVAGTDPSIRVISLEDKSENAITDFGGPGVNLAFDGGFAFAISFSGVSCGGAWCIMASPVGTTRTSVLANTGENPYALAVCGDYVFYADPDGGGRVVRIDRSGDNETVMATGQASIPSLACDASHVYWSGDRGVFRLAVEAAGGAPEGLAAGPSKPVTLSDGHVYWASQGRIERMAMSTGEVETLVDVNGIGGAFWIGVANEYLYWLTDSADITQRLLFRRLLCPGAANEQIPAEKLAFVTQEHVYYASDNRTKVVRRQH